MQRGRARVLGQAGLRNPVDKKSLVSALHAHRLATLGVKANALPLEEHSHQFNIHYGL